MSEKATSPQARPASQAAGRPVPVLGAPERISPVTTVKTGRRTVYVVSWGVLALAAGAYLTAIIAKPQFLNDWFPSMGPILTQPQGNDQNRSAAIAEAKQLRATLQDLQREVARLRRELGDRDARVKAAELRIARLEKEVQGTAAQPSAPRPDETASITGSGSPEAPNGSDATQRALASAIGAPREVTNQAAGTPAATAQSGQPRSFELVNGAIVARQGSAEMAAAGPQAGADVEVPLPARKPAVTAVRKALPIAQLKRPTIAVKPNTPTPVETGSVAAGRAVQAKPAAQSSNQPIAFGAPVVTRSAAPVGIRLTAGPSVDALRLSWALMSERYGADLGGLQPRYVMGNTPAAPYALVAGPFGSEQEAQRVCGSLIAKGIPCSVDGYGGNAL